MILETSAEMNSPSLRYIHRFIENLLPQCTARVQRLNTKSDQVAEYQMRPLLKQPVSNGIV